MGASRAQESSVRCGGTKKLELPCRSCRGAGRAARLKPPIPSTTGESRVKSNTTGAWFFAGLSVLAWLLTAYLAARAGESAQLRTFAWAAGFLAGVLSVHTLLYVGLAGRKPRDRAYYLQHGRPVDAVVTKVDKRGQRTAWRIKARYRDPRSGEEARFKSELLRANPGHRIRVGDSIRVYLDPERPNRHWMDTGTDAEYL